jgi:hypothetical protein
MNWVLATTKLLVPNEGEKSMLWLCYGYGVLLENRVLIFRFQLLAVYVLLVHNCGECRIGNNWQQFSNFLWLFSRFSGRGTH